MTVDIVGMGNHLIEYPDKNEFDSLKEYLTIAKKIIRSFADKLRPGLSIEMLNSEDAVSNIATAIMLADWRWNPNYRSKDGQVRTKHAYRNQCALWAIKGYIGRKSIEPKLVSLSTDSGNFNSPSKLEDFLPAKTPTPDFDMIEQEQKDKIEEMLQASCLTAQQERYIKLYYLENLTYQEIANESGCSREAVRQTIDRGINNIRKLGKDIWAKKTS